MRRYCGWLVAEGELAEHPMAGMAMPPAQPKPVPVLSDDDLAALLKACDGRDFASRRDTAVIRMLVDCGVRVSELCGITLADLDLNREVALVTGKGNKQRAIYFGARTGRALDRYLRERRTHRQARFTEALFLSQRGPLSPDGVRDTLNVRGAQAGITGLHRTGSDTHSPTTSWSPAARNATSSGSPAGPRTSCSSGTARRLRTCAPVRLSSGCGEGTGSRARPD